VRFYVNAVRSRASDAAQRRSRALRHPSDDDDVRDLAAFLTSLDEDYE